ncbi:MAG: hypothetical protein R2856_13690 [Caldilineaceae bacterium]
MSDPVLRYPLVAGYVHNWLVLGPFDGPADSPLSELAPLPEDANIVARELDRVDWQGRGVFWITAGCEDDHQLDWSGYLPVDGVRRVWAFAQIEASTVQIVTLHAAVLGSLHLWCNGERVLADGVGQASCTVTLRPGINSILARLEQRGVGHVALAMGLRVAADEATDLDIVLPTVQHDIELRQRLEKTFAQTRLERAVYTQEQPINLVLDAESDTPSTVNVRFQRPTGAIFSETAGKLTRQTPVTGARAIQLPTGELRAVVTPPLGEFYEQRLRKRHMHPFWVVRGAEKKHADPGERLADAVQRPPAAQPLRRYCTGCIGAMGTGAPVYFPRGGAACAASSRRLPARRRGVGRCDLAAWCRISAACGGTLQAQRGCARLCCAGARGARSVGGERSTALAHSMDAGLRTRSQRRYRRRSRVWSIQAVRPMMSWLRGWPRRGQNGFADVRTRLDHLVLALSHLVEVATDTLIRELAAVLLDRLLYDVAIYSIRGVYAPARGVVESAWLRSGRFTPEAAVSRLLWGLGSYDGDLSAAISLGLASGAYQLPEIIRAIALDRPQSAWVTERRRRGEDEVIHAAYKTTDFLLSSFQDYSPGKPGQREHVWQATLGPEALIFTNHPTTFSQSDSRSGAWWAGNGVLPRVYQWQDALAALYHLPEDDALGFTHAYFPTYAFDEHVFEAGWAFARVGDAYAAIWAAQGFSFMKRGPDAFRELRSPGQQNAWLCQLGSAHLDDDFAQFQQRVLAQKPEVDATGVTWRTIRGDLLRFTWTGPVQRNGEDVDLHTLPHHHSPYAYAELPATHMDIGIGPNVMRLDFRI